MRNSLKPIALLFALVFTAGFAFAEVEAEADKLIKDTDAWMNRLAEIIEWVNSRTDGEAFRFSREGLTNELERTEKLLADFEKIFRVKDPETAVKRWMAFERAHAGCRRLGDPVYKELFEEATFPDMTEKEAADLKKGLSRFYALKDYFLKYVREEEPFEEKEFYKALAETELKAEQEKNYHSHMTVLSVMQMFGPPAAPLNFTERKAEEWKGLEQKYASEADSLKDYPTWWKAFWTGYGREAKSFGRLREFKEGLALAIEKSPDYFFPVGVYCEALENEGKSEEAREFLKKHYPEDKLLLRPGDLKDYVKLFRMYGWDIDEKALVKNIFGLWLDKDLEKLAEGNQYLWERLWTKDYRELRKEVRARLMALSTPSVSVLKRVEEITSEQDFEAWLKKMPDIKTDQIQRDAGRSKYARERIRERAEEEDDYDDFMYFYGTGSSADQNVDLAKYQFCQEELEKEKDPKLDALDTANAKKIRYDVFDPMDPLNLYFIIGPKDWEFRKAYTKKKFKKWAEKRKVK